MRVLVAGDVHGDVWYARRVIRTARELECPIVVQVGDFGYWPSTGIRESRQFHNVVGFESNEADVEWWWLDGNHENFDALEQKVTVAASHPQRMECGLTYVGRGATWTWDGVSCMSLGGAYSIDQNQRVHGLSWWPQEEITTLQVEHARKNGPVDVMFTHDAPLGTVPFIEEGRDAYPRSRSNREAVSAVVDVVAPRLLVHGHYHGRYTTEYRLPNGNVTRVEALGCGQDAFEDSYVVLTLDNESGQLECTPSGTSY